MPVVLDRDQLVLEVRLAGFWPSASWRLSRSRAFLGSSTYSGWIGQRDGSRRPRRDAIAELQHGGVVDRHLQGVAHPLVVIGLLVTLVRATKVVAVATSDFTRADPVEDRRRSRPRSLVGIDLACLEGIDVGRGSVP